MATIRAYTTIEQSRKLAEILPLESADFCYIKTGFTRDNWMGVPEYQFKSIPYNDYSGESIGCWSLAALLAALPKIVNNETLFIETSAALWHIGYRNIYIARADNPIDACYEMIIKLHELSLL